MALVDLKTDLKSLKFEGGLNGKPFVVKDLDQSFEGFVDVNTQANNAIQTQGILAAKRIDDVVRMAKLVIAKPGLTYAIKGALSGFIEGVDSKQLYEKNPKLGKQLLEKAKDILLTAVTNTAQVPLNGLGLHLYKGNLNLDEKRRNYASNFSKTATVALQQPGHSSAKSQGIKKSKKLTIATNEEFGKIDYLEKPSNTFRSDFINTTNNNRLERTGEFDGDMIPFGFAIYDKQEPIYVQFRAFLDSFSDNFTGNWNQTRYLGRGESFKTYESFDRQVSLSFKVAAFTREDLLPIYKKLNLLASTTAPHYSDDGLFMKGTWVRMTVGDYLHKVPCTIGSVGFTWQQDYPWERKLQDKEKDTVQILPHVLDVTIAASIDHDFTPQTGLIPFIGNTSPSKEFIDWDKQKNLPEII